MRYTGLTPTHGLMDMPPLLLPSLSRHPDGKSLLARVSAQSPDMASLFPIPSAYASSHPSMDDWTLLSGLQKSSMVTRLATAFGAPDGSLPGKYGLANAFFFQCMGETILAVAEKGDRGTVWFWMDPPRTGMFFMDEPPVMHFWPTAVDELLLALGTPLREPSQAFPPNSLPSVRREKEALQASIGQALPPNRYRL